MTISKDRVMPSPMPDNWNLAQIFATGVGFGTYLAITSVIFFWAMYKTSWFSVSDTAGPASSKCCSQHVVWGARGCCDCAAGLPTLSWSSLLPSTRHSYPLSPFDCHSFSLVIPQTTFGVENLEGNYEKTMSALYLQVSVISQALIFVTRSQSFSFLERPANLLIIAFISAQLVSAY